MPEGVPEDSVVGVLTGLVEARFGMGLEQLKAAVNVEPDANPDATAVVRWHSLLVDAQLVLERAENDLLAALQTQPSEIDDPAMGLVHRVNEAVTARDGRATVVRWLVDPDALGKQGLAAERLARHRPRTSPAVQTGTPSRPAGTAVPATVRPSGRAAR
ncbi:hypothetical protein [Streptomyces sp. NPDC002530]